MSGSATLRTVVVVPARNEVARIGDCLRSLAGQGVVGVGVVVVANGCEDGTAALSRSLGASLGLTLDVLDCTFPSGAGVGTARRLGMAHALAACPGVTALLTTDADCRVAPDWIARTLHHLETVDGVCGRVAPMAGEVSVLDGMDIAPAELEGRYETLVLEFCRRMRPGPCGLEGDHGAAAGASLAVRVGAYRDVGGFADIATGEDRDLVRRLKMAGFGVRHAGDVRVAASCRLDGRATGGMADALRARAGRTRYLADESLPPAQALIDAATRGDIGPWPLQVAPEDRLHAADLAPHIARLQEALSIAGPAALRLATAESLTQVPSTPSQTRKHLKEHRYDDPERALHRTIAGPVVRKRPDGRHPTRDGR